MPAVIEGNPRDAARTNSQLGETGFDRKGFLGLLAVSSIAFHAAFNPRFPMAHVVTSKCSACKFTDCVEVCPVACFYELDNQVVIHPDDCIDCTACVDVCPVQAIYSDQNVPAEFADNTEFNSTQAKQVKDAGTPAITARKDPLPTAEARKKALGY